MTRISRVSKNPVVPAKVKAAFELMLDDPKMTWRLAAAAAGISTYSFRRALRLPHVRQWAMAEHRTRVDSICAANPERLRSIADTSANDMARVASIKALEQIKGELENPQRAGLAGQVTSPGLVVIIQNRDGTAQAFPAPPPAPQLVELDPVDGMRRPYQHEP
jgi:hypothetical protein